MASTSTGALSFSGEPAGFNGSASVPTLPITGVGPMTFGAQTGLDVAVEELFALAVHEADVHLVGVEVDSAVVFGGGGVILHMQLY